MSQNPANPLSGGKLSSFGASHLRGPLQFKVMENTELDKIHSNRQAIRNS
jgi:hypothetical protein